MKQSLARLRFFKLSGFTLVELLVVIGIIAILAGVLMTAVGAAMRAAKRAQAANLASAIQTSTLGYYTEYSVYPAPPGTTDTVITDVASSAATWGNLICVLSGNIHPSAPLTAFTATTITNSRGIAFLSLKATDVDANDAPKNPLPTGTQIYFNIAIDSDYDGLLGTTPPTSTVMPNFAAGSPSSLPLTGGTSTAGVAVWANCTGLTTFTNANFWVHTY